MYSTYKSVICIEYYVFNASRRFTGLLDNEIYTALVVVSTLPLKISKYLWAISFNQIISMIIAMLIYVIISIKNKSLSNKD